MTANEAIRTLKDDTWIHEVNEDGTAVLWTSYADKFTDALDLAISALSRDRWISVEERLPDDEESVFVVRKFLGIKGQVPLSTYTEIAYRIDDMWFADSDEYKIARSRHTDPMFWMPLPEPPKEET